MMAPVGAGKFSGGLRWTLLVGACALALRFCSGETVVCLAILAQGIIEVPYLLLTAISAAGFGYLVAGRLIDSKVPRMFVAATYVAVGLWVLSLLVLIAGTACRGALTPYVWWPVLISGVLPALWSRRKAGDSRKAAPRGFAWIVPLAVAGTLWLAGAMNPPGFMGSKSGESYDVLEYHLQLPKEYLEAGRITQLRHNVYSYYPLGGEMLFLLAFCLRGGAHSGMYLAQSLSGLWLLLTAMAVLSALSGEEPRRGKFAAAVAVTTPGALYLSWMAMVEPAAVCYLTLAVLWLRQWLASPSTRTACCIGLLLGGACCTKYLAVGFVAMPVLFIFLCCRRPKCLSHALLAGALAAVAFSPWLVRNIRYTGNPVFPLATGIFGRGHWSSESERRWVCGHGPAIKPPVPTPPGWSAPEHGAGWQAFSGVFAGHNFGYVAPALACVMAILAAMRPAVHGSTWDRCLAALFALQLIVWPFTHGMPWRFLTPAIVPISLLAARLVEMTATPRNFGRIPWPKPGKAAAALLIAAITINVALSLKAYSHHTSGSPPGPVAGKVIAAETAEDLGPGKTMLLGSAMAFYYPPGTRYATCFDRHPLEILLAQGLGEREIMEIAMSEGVTHIVVCWREIWRLAGTYGFPHSLSAELYYRWQARRPVGLRVFDGMIAHGARALAADTAHPPVVDSRTWDPWQYPRGWPELTIYELPAQVSTRHEPNLFDVGGTTCYNPGVSRTGRGK